MSKSQRKPVSSRPKSQASTKAAPAEPVEPKKKCPHCGDHVTLRTIRTHLLNQRRNPDLSEEPIDVFEGELMQFTDRLCQLIEQFRRARTRSAV